MKPSILALTLTALLGAHAKEARDKREDYCTGRPKGFLCINGVTDKYYECSYPYYEGWRFCGTGTMCTVVGLHSSTPCKAPRGGGEEDNDDREDGQDSVVGNSSSTLEEGSSKVGEKGDGNIFEKLKWWHWLLIGVAAFLILGVIISFLIRLWIHMSKKRKERKDDPEWKGEQSKAGYNKKGMSPAATVLCISSHAQINEVDRKADVGSSSVNESVVTTTDSTSTTIGSSSSSSSSSNSDNDIKETPNLRNRELMNTM